MLVSLKIVGLSVFGLKRAMGRSSFTHWQECADLLWRDWKAER